MNFHDNKQLGTETLSPSSIPAHKIALVTLLFLPPPPSSSSRSKCEHGECEVTGALSNNVIWKRNNVQLENGAEFRISSGTLVMLEFSSDMVGNYTCVADYAEGTLSSRAIVLTLACKSTLPAVI